MQNTTHNGRSASRRPRPESFDEYRSYLRAIIAHLRESRRGFSYRRFSRRAGFSSPNFLKLVAEGQRNLSAASIGKFARGLGLDAEEREAFELLVLMAQADTDTDRMRYYDRLTRMRRRVAPAAGIQPSQTEVYRQWWSLIIRELIRLADFREDAEWIRSRLRVPLRLSQVRKALGLLEEVGMAVRDGAGRLRPTSDHVRAAGPLPLVVRNFHRAMLRRAEDTLDQLATDQRNITTVLLPLTREEYERACERVAELRSELLEQFDHAGDDDTPREVYALGFQVFPLTQSKPKAAGRHRNGPAAAASKETP
jgi:uncharacterized protein (TIGR02147 family)